MKSIPSTDLREDFSSWQDVESDSVGQNIPQVIFNFIDFTPCLMTEWIHCWKRKMHNGTQVYLECLNVASNLSTVDELFNSCWLEIYIDPQRDHHVLQTSESPQTTLSTKDISKKLYSFRRYPYATGQVFCTAQFTPLIMYASSQALNAIHSFTNSPCGRRARSSYLQCFCTNHSRLPHNLLQCRKKIIVIFHMERFPVRV